MQTVIANNKSPRRILAKHKSEAAYDVPAIAQVITENWRKSVQGILKVAQECAKAKNKLSQVQKQQLYELLPFGESMFSKLATIGDDPRLLKHQDLLPLSISTIYEAKKLPDDQFEAAIKEGVLKPDVKREDFKLWVNSKDNGKALRSKPQQVELPPGLICLYMDAPPSGEQLTSMKTGAIELAERLGVKVAIFTGETAMAQFKRHWAKKPSTLD